MLRALDLFCKAGGATRGLQLAGFHVTGVDIEPQPRYVGDAFIQGDALEVELGGYDFIWASPPCQAFATWQSWMTSENEQPAGEQAGLGQEQPAQARHPRIVSGSSLGRRTWPFS